MRTVEVVLYLNAELAEDQGERPLVCRKRQVMDGVVRNHCPMIDPPQVVARVRRQ